MGGAARWRLPHSSFRKEIGHELTCYRPRIIATPSYRCTSRDSIREGARSHHVRKPFDAKLRKGDERALNELVEQHHGALIRMAMRYVADRDAA